MSFCSGATGDPSALVNDADEIARAKRRTDSAVTSRVTGRLTQPVAGAYRLVALAVVYDWQTSKRIHAVYKVAVPAILLGEVATTIISHAPSWVPIARFLIGR